MAKEVSLAKPIVSELSPNQRERYSQYANGIPYVLQKCIACHAQGVYSAAPHIPFDNPIELKQALAAQNGSLLQEIDRRTQPDAPMNIRMPRGPVTLMQFQHDALMKYLKSLWSGLCFRPTIVLTLYLHIVDPLLYFFWMAKFNIPNREYCDGHKKMVSMRLPERLMREVERLAETKGWTATDLVCTGIVRVADDRRASP